MTLCCHNVEATSLKCGIGRTMFFDSFWAESLLASFRCWWLPAILGASLRNLPIFSLYVFTSSSLFVQSFPFYKVISHMSCGPTPVTSLSLDCLGGRHSFQMRPHSEILGFGLQPLCGGQSSTSSTFPGHMLGFTPQ